MPSTHPLETFFLPDNVAGGASEPTISQAEATLDVRFPPSYRSFLARFGAGFSRGIEVAGLFHHPDKAEWLSSMSSKTRQMTEAEWKYSVSAAPTTPFSRPSHPLWIHVVTWNLRKRRINRGHIESRYVAISHDGSEATFLLDTGAPEPESPVVVLGPGWDFVLVAPDFNAFAIAGSNGTLAY
jgi:SMI1-KNR4 cell-wall